MNTDNRIDGIFARLEEIEQKNISINKKTSISKL